MNKKNRKGFTIIELVIVIAVIGILTAILVPTFMGISKSAQSASEKSFLRNVNTQLAMREVEEGKNETMYDAVQEANDLGFDIEKLTPVDGNDIIWDSVANRFALVTPAFDPANPNADESRIVISDGALQGKGAELWKIYTTMPGTQTFSIYAKNTWNGTATPGVSVGFDAGNVKTFTKITFNNSSSGKYVFRTNAGTDVDFTGALAEPHFYGESNKVTIFKVKADSAHIKGSVKSLEINDGRAVFEPKSVTGLFVPKPNGGEVKYEIKDNATVGLLKPEVGTGEKITGRTGSSSKVVNLTWDININNCDIRFGSRPLTYDTHDREEGNVAIDGLGNADGPALSTSCSMHAWTPSASAAVAVCANCGEIKFNKVAINEETGEPEEVPYTVDVGGNEAEIVARNTEYGFFDSFVDDDHWVHLITNKAEFQNIMTHIYAKEGMSAEEYPLANENTIYRILNDIDFEGDAYSNYNIANYHVKPFIGKLEGASGFDDGSVKLSRIGAHTLNSEVAEIKMYGLFDAAYYATFSNLIISQSTIDENKAKPAGLIVGGSEGSLAETSGTFVGFYNVTVDATCRVRGNSSCGAFAGRLRGINTLEFINCTNHANVIADGSHSAGGFCGGISAPNNSGHRYNILKNCTNFGNITAGGSVGAAGGFFAQSQTSANTIHWTLENVSNHGTIRTPSSTLASAIFCYYGDNFDNAAFESVVNVSNSGHIIVNSLTPHAGAYGSTSNSSEATDPILINGESGSFADYYDAFISTYVMDEFSIVGVCENSYNPKTLTLDLSSATDDFKTKAAKISIITRITTFNISYESNTGSGSSSGMGTVNTKTFSISEWNDSYSIPRLLYCGNTYPLNYTEPEVLMDPNDPNSYRYNFEYNQIASNDEHERGYHVLSDGSAYFIHNNTNVTSGIYYVTAKFPSMVYYEARIFDASDVQIGYTKLVTDLYPTRSILRISDIPDNVTTID